MKPVRLSKHATGRALLRGATEAQVITCIGDSKPDSLGNRRYTARKTFSFESNSPVNGKYYRYKTVEVIFAEEDNEVVIITVKVYYSNEERNYEDQL